jgi:hypothetical protein
MMPTEVMTDEWIAEMVTAAGCLGQRFVGTPEDEMTFALHHIEADLEDRLQSLGADAASTIAESFVATVIRVRRELEAGGETSPRLLN